MLCKVSELLSDWHAFSFCRRSETISHLIPVCYCRQWTIEQATLLIYNSSPFELLSTLTIPQVINAFVFAGFVAMGAGVLLLVDMAYLVFLAHRESRGQSIREWFIMFSIIYWGFLSGFSNEHYQRAAYSIDTTLHSLSDTQLVASIGLLSLCSTRAAISRHTTTTSCATCFSCLWSHILALSIFLTFSKELLAGTRPTIWYPPYFCFHLISVQKPRRSGISNGRSISRHLPSPQWQQ